MATFDYRNAFQTVLDLYFCVIADNKTYWILNSFDMHAFFKDLVYIFAKGKKC